MQRAVPAFLAVLTMLLLAACATLPGREPIQVTVAGMESLPGEGLEMRMLVKLRVQNPNDQPLEYDGVYVKVEVQDKTFAAGVSAQKGSVPRFGESVISVPVTISTMRAAFNALNLMLDSRSAEKITYKMSGKLDGPMFGSTSFQADGEFSFSKP